MNLRFILLWPSWLDYNRVPTTPCTSRLKTKKTKNSFNLSRKYCMEKSSWYYSRNIEGDIRDNVPPVQTMGGRVPPVPYGSTPLVSAASTDQFANTDRIMRSLHVRQNNAVKNIAKHVLFFILHVTTSKHLRKRVRIFLRPRPTAPNVDCFKTLASEAKYSTKHYLKMFRTWL